MHLHQKTASPMWHGTELQRGFLQIQLQLQNILALVWYTFWHIALENTESFADL